jgi:hypothetical protein
MFLMNVHILYHRKLHRTSCYWGVRARLHLRFGCAVWMCIKPSAAMTCDFDVQQNSRPISETQHRAARPAARRAAYSAACVFDVIFSFQPIF